LKNENDIKIQITAGKTNENENYYKLKNEDEKSGGKPYTAILCQPTITWLLVHGLKIAVLFGGSAAGSVPH